MVNTSLLFRMLGRALRTSESRVLLASLTIAVAALASVSFFADRVSRAIELQAGELIGGDLSYSSDKPLEADVLAAIRAKANVRSATTTTFPSMSSFAKDGDVQAQLVDIKAVTDGFPLRGQLMLADQLADIEAGKVKPATTTPDAGTVWLAPQMAGKLGINIGDTLRLGQAQFKVAAWIAKEPDAVLDYFGLAPRVIIRESDVAATQLLQVGSRVGYKILMAGDPGDIADLRKSLTPLVKRGQRVAGPADAQSEVRVSLERAGRILSLASLFSVILAAAAAALAARRFSQRQTNSAALLRCLGASRSEVFALYFIQIAVLALLASLLGVALGAAGQWLLAKLLQSLFATALPAASFTPWLHALAVGFVLFLGFTVPPLVRLRSVPALRVLRQDLGGQDLATWITVLIAAGAMIGLIVWRAGDLKIGLVAVGGFAGALFIGSVLSLILLQLVGPLRGVTGSAGGGAVRYGLANLARRKSLTLLQVGALGLGIMAILLLVFVRSDLLERVQGRLPADTPNRFAINIQPQQVEPFKAALVERGLTGIDLYPMVRARLVGLNDQAFTESNFSADRARRLAEREFNLSWQATERKDNPVVAGKWWAADDKTPQFSIEEGIAKTLGLKLGDTLTYDVAGTRFTAKVTSIRKLQWDTFRPNFFVVANPGVLESFPASFITSFKLPAGQERVVNQLVAQYPNVSVIDLTAIMNQVRSVSDQVSRAVEFVFLFALASGILVLYAAIVATQDERAYEGAVMRTLGAAKRQLLNMQAAEFAAIGILAGLVASIGAYGLGAALSEQLGLGAGAIGITIAGLLGTYRTVNTPPLASIRSNS
jgi:putative ABC transport system permease protein